MSAQEFEFEFADANQLLHHLLYDLQQQPDISVKEMSGTPLNMAEVVREFYTETSRPYGRAQFLRYCLVWLDNSWPADTVCSLPGVNEYETAWHELRGYQNKSSQAKRKILECLAGFGEHLILRCIYPMMARSNSISQPAGSSQASHLREECFRRDGNRCAVSGAFNLDESVGRVARGYLDDDDNSLHANTHGFGGLQVAYIIPRALGWRDDADIASILPHLNVLMILDMFRPGTMERYSGNAIDRPDNAISMDLSTHKMFGDLQIYFEPRHDSQACYTVHYVNEPIPPLPQYPKNIIFRSVTDVMLPDTNLLAIHKACARIAHATGAAESGIRFFRDLEDGAIAADGSTPLGQLVAYRLGFCQG